MTMIKFGNYFMCQIIRHYSSSYKWSYVSGPSDLPLIGSTLGQVIDNSAEKYVNQIALTSMHQGPVRKSFKDVQEDSNKLAAGLLSLGLRPGDRIGIWGPNSYEWYQTQMASAQAGLILVNVNPAYKSHELKYCINKVEIKALVSARKFKTTDYYETLCELVEDRDTLKGDGIPSLEHVIMMKHSDFNGQAKGTLEFDDIVHAGSHENFYDLKEIKSKIQMDDPVNIQFTSGTTGNPKGACLSHHNIINNGMFIGHRLGYDKKTQTICLCPPLYHTFGCVIGNVCSLIYGANNVLPGHHFNAQESLKAIESEKCTAIYGTPTMFNDLIACQRNQNLNVSSVYTGVMAGSPCPMKLCEDVIRELNMTDFTICYGMTETSPVTFQGFPEDSIELKTSTIGYPSCHTEVKIIDENGQVVPVGVPGELCIRGYANMLGYWNDKEKTEELISKDRWLHSGDIAVIYENGYGNIVGRLKDLVIRGGENLYPREIEEILLRHPNVQDAHVVGVPDERFGEELCAWVKLNPIEEMAGNSNVENNESSIRVYLKEHLAHFKVPKYFLFVGEFPTTVTGKVQKFKMKEESIKILGLTNI